MKTLYTLMTAILLVGFTSSSAQLLRVLPPIQNVGPAASQTTFKVSGTVFSWGVSDNASWLTTSVSGKVITAKFSANPNPSPRIALITVKDGVSKNAIVSVVQTGTILTVSPTSFNVDNGIHSKTINVNANVGWSVSDDASWLSTTKTSASTVRVNITSNSTTSIRTAKISVKGNGVTRVVKVTQAADDPYIEIIPPSQEVGSAAGSTSFSVRSNVTWSASENERWLNITGTAGGKLSVDYAKNEETSPRSGVIVVSGGGLSKKVKLVQAAAVPYLNIKPATQLVGSLAGSISFTISSNVDWSSSCPERWIRMIKVSERELGVRYENNNSTSRRIAIIEVSGEGESEQVKVEQAGADPYLDVSPDSESVNSKAGSISFSVSANVSWTVSDDVSWLTATKNGSKIDISYKKNSGTNARTANISASGGGLSETVTVTQSGASPNISVSPDSESVDSKSGTTSFSVNANVDWSVSDNASWLKASKTDDKTISVSYNSNSSTNARTAKITATGGGESETVTLTQAGSKPYLDISPLSETVSSEAGSLSFSVSTNVSWTVSDDASWLSATKDGDKISVSYKANTAASPRTANITANGSEGVSEKVTLTQAGEAVAYYIDLSTNSVEVSCEGGSVSVTVNSNVDWSVSSSESWLSVSKTDASTLTISCEENAIENERTATLTLTGEGISRFITVVQEKAGPTAIDDHAHSQSIILYPNPAKEVLYLKAVSVTEEDMMIDLFDIRGKQIHSQIISQPAKGEIISIDLTVLESGIYFIRLNNSKTYKFQKQ